MCGHQGVPLLGSGHDHWVSLELGTFCITEGGWSLPALRLPHDEFCADRFSNCSQKISNLLLSVEFGVYIPEIKATLAPALQQSIDGGL